MKIISNLRWDGINTKIKSLREQVAEITEECITLNNKLKEKTFINEKLIEDNRAITQSLLDLEVQLENEKAKTKNLKKDNKILKNLCTKNDINYKEVLMNKSKDEK